MDEVIGVLRESGVDLEALRTRLAELAVPPRWQPAGDGRWTSPDGVLLRAGARMVELHGDTVHVYAEGAPTLPAGVQATSTGSPLDGWHWLATGEGVRLPGQPSAETFWSALASHADRPFDAEGRLQ